MGGGVGLAVGLAVSVAVIAGFALASGDGLLVGSGVAVPQALQSMRVGISVRTGARSFIAPHFGRMSSTRQALAGHIHPTMY